MFLIPCPTTVSSLVVSTINLLNPTPPLLDYSLIATNSLLNPVHSDTAMNFDQDKTIASYAKRNFLPDALSGMINKVVKRTDQPGTVRTLFLDHSGSSYAQNPQGFSQYLQELDKDTGLRRVIIVIPNKIENSFVPAGKHPFTNDFFAPGLEQLGLAHVSTQVFDRANTRVEIYEK